jgi:hypothetical protein
MGQVPPTPAKKRQEGRCSRSNAQAVRRRTRWTSAGSLPRDSRCAAPSAARLFMSIRRPMRCVQVVRHWAPDQVHRTKRTRPPCSAWHRRSPWTKPPAMRASSAPRPSPRAKAGRPHHRGVCLHLPCSFGRHCLRLLFRLRLARLAGRQQRPRNPTCQRWSRSPPVTQRLRAEPAPSLRPLPRTSTCRPRSRLAARRGRPRPASSILETSTCPLFHLLAARQPAQPSAWASRSRSERALPAVSSSTTICRCLSCGWRRTARPNRCRRSARSICRASEHPLHRPARAGIFQPLAALKCPVSWATPVCQPVRVRVCHRHVSPPGCPRRRLVCRPRRSV